MEYVYFIICIQLLTNVRKQIYGASIYGVYNYNLKNEVTSFKSDYNFQTNNGANSIKFVRLMDLRTKTWHHLGAKSHVLITI